MRARAIVELISCHSYHYLSIQEMFHTNDNQLLSWLSHYSSTADTAFLDMTDIQNIFDWSAQSCSCRIASSKLLGRYVAPCCTSISFTKTVMSIYPEERVGIATTSMVRTILNILVYPRTQWNKPDNKPDYNTTTINFQYPGWIPYLPLQNCLSIKFHNTRLCFSITMRSTPFFSIFLADRSNKLDLRCSRLSDLYFSLVPYKPYIALQKKLKNSPKKKQSYFYKLFNKCGWFWGPCYASRGLPIIFSCYAPWGLV